MKLLLIALLIPAGLFGQAFNQIEVLPKADGSASGNLIFYNEDYTAQIKANHDATTDGLLTWKDGSAVLIRHAAGGLSLGTTNTAGDLYVYDAGWDDDITQGNVQAGSLQSTQPLLRFFLNDGATLIGAVGPAGQWYTLSSGAQKSVQDASGFNLSSDSEIIFYNNADVSLGSADSGVARYGAGWIRPTNGAGTIASLRTDDLYVEGEVTSTLLTHNLSPAATNTWQFGSSSARWTNVYSYDGNFADDVTVTGSLSVGDVASTINPATTDTYALGSSALNRWATTWVQQVWAQDGNFSNTLVASGTYLTLTAGTDLRSSTDGGSNLGTNSFSIGDLYLDGSVFVNAVNPPDLTLVCPAGQAIVNLTTNEGWVMAASCGVP